MATYPHSVARLVRPNAPQLKKSDDPKISAVQRRLSGLQRVKQRGSAINAR